MRRRFSDTSLVRSLFALLALSSGLALVAGCGGANAANAKGAKAAPTEDDETKVARWMAREAKPQPERKVSLLGGLVEGTIEAEQQPKIECDEKNGIDSCGFGADLGKDEDGEGIDLICTASSETPNFGYIVRNALDGAGLAEMPTLSSAPVGPGFSFRFVANSIRKSETGTKVGTVKVAVLYSQNYAVACIDTGSGNRKSFTRIIDKYFASLTFKTNPKRPAYLAQGRVLRQGDQIIGMIYSYIGKRNDDKPGTDETSRIFFLETDGKTWSHFDQSSSYFRDPSGTPDRTVEVISADGKTIVALTSKPSEGGGKLRLKAEVAGKTESLELQPKERLSTEIWSAPELLRVSRGERPTHKYSHLDLNDDREPAFAYTTLTKKAAGLLQEKNDTAHKKDPSKEAETNELQIDEEGFVKKQVSSKAITELTYKWGKLPKEASAGKSK